MVEQMPAHAHSVVRVCVHVHVCISLVYVTEFWKITHMVAREII